MLCHKEFILMIFRLCRSKTTAMVVLKASAGVCRKSPKEQG